MYVAGKNVKWCRHCGSSLAVLQKVKHRITIWPSNSTPRYIPKRSKNTCPPRNLHVSVYSSIRDISQFIALHRCCIFYKLKVCGNPALSKSIGATFPTTFAHFLSLSHFGNSHNISTFSFIIICVTMICDLQCYYCKNITTGWRLRWWLAFFSNKMFFKLRYVHCF